MAQRVFQTESGESIKIKPVNLVLMDDLIAANPPPAKPTIKVSNPDGEISEMPSQNKGDLEKYEAELIKYQSKIQQMFTEIVLVEGCDFELTEEQQRLVDSYRARMERRGINLNPDDKYVFIVYIQVANFDEMGRLTDRILNLNQATKEAFAKAGERFRGKVEG